MNDCAKSCCTGQKCISSICTIHIRHMYTWQKCVILLYQWHGDRLVTHSPWGLVVSNVALHRWKSLSSVRCILHLLLSQLKHVEQLVDHPVLLIQEPGLLQFSWQPNIVELPHVLKIWLLAETCFLQGIMLPWQQHNVPVVRVIGIVCRVTTTCVAMAIVFLRCVRPAIMVLTIIERLQFACHTQGWSQTSWIGSWLKCLWCALCCHGNSVLTITYGDTFLSATIGRFIS